MKAEVLSKFDLPWLPVTAQLLFIAVFAGFVYYAYRKKNQSLFAEQAMLPLEQENNVEVNNER
jgi:cbb3-type cytochrome oxidase subunit 3